MIKQWLAKARLIPVIGVLISVAALVQAPIASASNFSATWGYSKDVTFMYVDYDPDNSYIYDGYLRDTTTPNGYCVEMQRKNSSGNWIRTGFTNYNTGKTNTTISACTTSYVEWALPSNYAAGTYGLRMVDGSGRYLTMCSSKADCKQLHN